jgi:hypothetical protein
MGTRYRSAPEILVPLIHKAAELKQKGMTYAQLSEELQSSTHETDRKWNNKVSRGGLSAAFLLQCLTAIEVNSIVEE